MDSSVWQHQIARTTVDSAARLSSLEAFMLGIAVGAVIVGVAACCPRSQARGRSTGRRRPLVARWIDLFRLVGGVARATLLLVAGLLLLGRVLCWPAGRRW